MPYVRAGRENSADVMIHYEDHGSGPPVVLSHGYPLSGRAWERQVPALLEAGHRVISYDRRGWGGSSHPAAGYEFDTFAADLNALMEHLDLLDAVLVGHSMGSGDVTHYLGRYGSGRVSKGVLIAPIPPYFLAADDDRQGVPAALFTGMLEQARADRPSWLKDFLDLMYTTDVQGKSRISSAALQAAFNIAIAGSAIAAVECIRAWATDFRADVAALDVPILVLQGDEDRVLPIELTGLRLAALVQDLALIVVNGGPHGIPWTHAAQINQALLNFID